MLNVKQDTHSPVEVAEVIGVTVGTLAAWRCRNKGPKFVRIAGRIRYPKTEVQEWLEEQIKAA